MKSCGYSWCTCLDEFGDIWFVHFRACLLVLNFLVMNSYEWSNTFLNAFFCPIACWHSIKWNAAFHSRCHIITKLPLQYIKFILFHFLFKCLFHFDHPSSKNDNSFNFNPNLMQFFVPFSLWCACFFGYF